MKQQVLEGMVRECGNQGFNKHQKRFLKRCLIEIYKEYKKEFERGIDFEIRHREVLRDYDLIK